MNVLQSLWTASSEKKEVVKVLAKMYNRAKDHPGPEVKKFSLDPQLTSFEILQSFLRNGFQIGEERFTVSYLLTDEHGFASYTPLSSDWDLDAAFSMAADPCLQIKVENMSKPDDVFGDDWDLVGSPEIVATEELFKSEKINILSAWSTNVTQQMGRAVSNVHRSISRTAGLLARDQVNVTDRSRLGRGPMSDSEFRQHMDGVGRINDPSVLRLAVYQGGVEPGLRKVLWRHLLDVFPLDMSGTERFDYMRSLCAEYESLRDQVTTALEREENVIPRVEKMITVIKNDVLRTDRSHKFYAGSDDNPHLGQLFSVLLTYAVTHPDTGYWQGMSDLASPLLLVQQDESHAYVCFCALMERLRHNFRSDGQVITQKIRQLSQLLRHFDPELHAQLELSGAGDLFFTYRWLLIELKREFPLDDVLRLLEIMWATVQPKFRESSIRLTEVEFSASLLTDTQTSSYNPLLLRRRNSSLTISSPHRPHNPSSPQSLPTRPSLTTPKPLSQQPLNGNALPSMPEDNESSESTDERSRSTSTGTGNTTSDLSSSGTETGNGVGEHSESEAVDIQSSTGELEASGASLPPTSSGSWLSVESDYLPGPDQLGHGNPFLLFLCLGVLMQQRERILRTKPEYEELHVLFDRLVRRQHVQPVIQRAQTLYSDYLRSQQFSTASRRSNEEDCDFQISL